MSVRKAHINIIKNIVMWIITLLMLIPLVLILINSLKDRYQASSMGLDLPKSLHFENYTTVIEKGKLWFSFFNSMLYSVISIVIVVLLSTMAAYVLSRSRTKFNRFIYFFVTLGIAMPVNYVSLTKVMQITHLINTRVGVCLLFVAIQIPFTVFLIYGFVSTVPRELDESGVIDGCSPLRLFFSIVFPLLKPVIVTVSVLNFMNVWNDFVIPLYYLNSASKWPMTLAVYNFFGQFQMSWNLVSADIILTSLPVIVIYLMGQKYIVSGMTSGAVKG
jgi:raffinose/stachyose/melibiose transport system permease protein